MTFLIKCDIYTSLTKRRFRSIATPAALLQDTFIKERPMEVIDKEEYEIINGVKVKKNKKAFSVTEDEDTKNSEDNLVCFAGDDM